jgi:hypothetical protein
LKVWPTKSGVTVLRRDQVLIGFLTAEFGHPVDFIEEFPLDERAFFERACHD